jgi:hypothetical protein
MGWKVQLAFYGRNSHATRESTAPPPAAQRLSPSQMIRLSPSPNWPFAIGHLQSPDQAVRSHTAAKAEGRMQNAETQDNAIPSHPNRLLKNP